MKFLLLIPQLTSDDEFLNYASFAVEFDNYEMSWSQALISRRNYQRETTISDSLQLTYS